jgi:mannose-6-phosphate isomerase
VLYPLTFQPTFKERVWGGRELERLYGKKLPPGAVIGESWEISDRPGDVSVITNGPLAGKDLRWLMTHHAAEVLGNAKPAAAGRFPLLCKILDARDKLSLQVHPPANKAVELGGEPKTEMWYVADAAPGASLYVGLKRGVTRAEFEKKIADGSVAECFHRIPVRAGDTMFLPSGRVHAIGAGLVIFEIQQNSDSTYRVFDWHRVGLDGKPRELHVGQSLACIDFDDFEPKLVEIKPTLIADATYKMRNLVQDPLFIVHEMTVATSKFILMKGGTTRIIAVVKGAVKVHHAGCESPVEMFPGKFCLLPASLKMPEVETKPDTTYLCVEAN